MKIGILTLQLQNNYGGLWQAYALQTMLEEWDHSVTVIRHRGLRPSTWQKLVAHWIPGWTPVRLRNGKWGMRGTRRKARQYISRHMRAFVDQHIRLTEREYGPHNLTEVNGECYDAVIVGSDQVWRPSYAGRIQSYFLDFVKEGASRKIAYAASFGASEWNFSASQSADCRALLAGFAGVSVRERNALEWCKHQLGREAQLVVDPALLLGREHYHKLCCTTHATTPTLCSYILDPSKPLSDAVDAYARKHQVSPVRPMPKCHYDDVGESGLEHCVYPPVTDWVTAFRDAEFVITDSFHGTVLAVIFNKSFLTLCNKARGAPRFESFLGELNLTERLIDHSDSIEDTAAKLSPVDWGSVNRKLEQWRQQSIEFLKESLKSQ